MYHNEYQHMNEQINPNPDLADRVMEQATPRRRASFRPAVAIALVMVMLLVATPVMAEHMPWILERIAPQLVKELEPVQRSHTNNGIMLEVVGASVKGNQAELVVKLQGESLIDPVGVAPDLFTNLDGLSSVEYTALSDYDGVEEDRANGIYYYQALMTYRKDISLEEILAGELTVTVNSIMLTSSKYSGTCFPITPVESGQITMIRMADLEQDGFNSFACENIQDCRHGCTLDHDLISPCEEMMYAVTDEVGITCISFLDGKLHIQMKAKTGSKYQEYAYWLPYLKDAEGNEKYPMRGYQYGIDDGMDYAGYSEYIFSVSEEEMENYTIHFDYRYTIRPECRVTFRFTEDEVMAE